MILRGRLLEYWLLAKMRKLESLYLKTLVETSQTPRAQEQPPQFKHGSGARKIFFIGDIQWELKELIPELEKFCDVTVLNLHPYLRGTPPEQFKQKVTRVIETALKQQHPKLNPDVIFLYARAALLSDEVFQVLRREWSCPIIGMNLDDKIEFLNYGLFAQANDNYQRWAKQFDINISNVRAAVDLYENRGLPVYYMAEGYHPKPEYGPPGDKPDFCREIAFVGSWRWEREQIIRRLQHWGVPVQPLGTGWPESEAGNHPEGVYRTSMMNLGIGFASPSRKLTTLKTRDFECPGAGACYLTTYNWELGLHYEIGKEILCYRSLEELVELFSFYRRRPEDCLKMAQAAYRRGLAEHTWEKRFRKFFRETGLMD